jgi:hypothetical protein
MQNWLPKTIIALVIVGTGWLTLYSQAPTVPVIGSGTADAIQIVPSMLANGGQQIVLVDSRTRSMAVYHIEAGKVSLKSVRNLTWDFAMEQFNGQSPLPSELRQIKP